MADQTDDARVRAYIARRERMDEIKALPPEEQLAFERGMLATYARCLRNVVEYGLTEEQKKALFKPDWTTIEPIPQDNAERLEQEGQRIAEQVIKELLTSIRQ